MSPPPGAPQQPQPPNSRKRVISVDYEPIYTKFSGIIPLTVRAEQLQNFFYDAPLGAAHPPFVKHALPGPITNRFLRNFQELIP